MHVNMVKAGYLYVIKTPQGETLVAYCVERDEQRGQVTAKMRPIGESGLVTLKAAGTAMNDALMMVEPRKVLEVMGCA